MFKNSPLSNFNKTDLYRLAGLLCLTATIAIQHAGADICWAQQEELSSEELDFWTDESDKLGEIIAKGDDAAKVNGMEAYYAALKDLKKKDPTVIRDSKGLEREVESIILPSYYVLGRADSVKRVIDEAFRDVVAARLSGDETALHVDREHLLKILRHAEPAETARGNMFLASRYGSYRAFESIAIENERMIDLDFTLGQSRDYNMRSAIEFAVKRYGVGCADEAAFIASYVVRRSLNGERDYYAYARAKYLLARICLDQGDIELAGRVIRSTDEIAQDAKKQNESKRLASAIRESLDSRVDVALAEGNGRLAEEYLLEVSPGLKGPVKSSVVSSSSDLVLFRGALGSAIWQDNGMESIDSCAQLALASTLNGEVSEVCPLSEQRIDVALQNAKNIGVMSPQLFAHHHFAHSRVLALMDDDKKTVESINRWRKAEHETTGELRYLGPKGVRTYIQKRHVKGLQWAVSWGFAHRDATVSKAAAEWLLNAKGLGEQLEVRFAAEQHRMIAQGEQNAMLKRLYEIRIKLAQIDDPTNFELTNLKSTKELYDLKMQEIEFSQALGEIRHEVEPWTTLEAFQKRLGNAVHLDILAAPTWNKKLMFFLPWDPADYHYYACVTLGSEHPSYSRTDGGCILLDLGEQVSLDKSILTLRDRIAMAAKSDGQGKSSIASDRMLLSQVAESVLAPIEPYIVKTDRLFLNPDGMFWLLPWSALPLASSGKPSDERLLLDQVTIQFVSRSQSIMGGADAAAKVQSRDAYVFGNPHFDCKLEAKRTSIRKLVGEQFRDDLISSDDAAEVVAELDFVPLPNTEVEAKSAAKSIGEAYKGLTVRTFLREEALEAVTKQLRSPRILVFSTHGFLAAEDQADFSDIETRGVTKKTLQTLAGKSVFDRCGLLLAGCKSNAKVQDDDGVLTGREVSCLDLSGTELVVLSACDSGNGDANAGEGVSGLRQAFQTAGARSVVSALWEIPDRDSSVIMHEFYQQIANGQDPAKALRSAQLKRRKQRLEKYGDAPPLYWAAWNICN